MEPIVFQALILDRKYRILEDYEVVFTLLDLIEKGETTASEEWTTAAKNTRSKICEVLGIKEAELKRQVEKNSFTAWINQLKQSEQKK